MTSDEVRIASIADAAELVRLINMAYRPTHDSVGWTHEADLVSGNRTNPDQIRMILTKPGSVMLVVQRIDLIIACVHLELIGRSCHIGLFAVNPAFQGTGIGKQLLARAEVFAAERFCVEKFVMTVVSARHELISFYLRRGYQRTGEIMDYPLSLGAGRPKHAFLKVEMLEKRSSMIDQSSMLNAPETHKDKEGK